MAAVTWYGCMQERSEPEWVVLRGTLHSRATEEGQRGGRVPGRQTDATEPYTVYR